MIIEVDDFEELMVTINSELIDDGVEIPARPISAAIRAMQFLKASGPIAGNELQPADYPLTTENIASHIYAWYENLYKDRLKVDFAQAKFPYLVHGDVFEVRVPYIIGQCLILSSKEKFEDQNILNAVDQVEDLPRAIRSTLTGIQENELQANFSTCIQVVRLMRLFKGNDYIDSALKDSFVSCENLTLRPKSPALSAWHAVQFTEKIIKYYISRNKFDVRRSHNICKLLDDAKEAGYEPDPVINWSLLSSITPNARYEPGNITLKDAVRINLEAWRVAFNVLHQVDIQKK